MGDGTNLRRTRPVAPQLTLQKLDVFCCVADYASVTKAAEQLGLAQPAVTAHLRDIEDKVGVRLVEKVGRNIALTEAGRRFLAWASEMLTRSFEMQRELSGLAGGTSGDAVIASSMTFGTYVLTDLVTAFHGRFPDTRITTKIANTRQSTEAVRTGACDFAVLLLDPKQDLDGLVLSALWYERLLLVTRRDDASIGDTASEEALRVLPFVAAPEGLVRRDLEDEALFTQGIVHRRIVMQLGHPEAIKRAVRSGAGLTFIEETAVRDEIERGDLRVVATPGIEIRLPLFLAYRRGKSLSVMQRDLIRFLRLAKPPGLHAAS